MNLQHGFALSLRIKISNRCHLTFKDSDNNELRVVSDLSLHQLRSERIALRRDLEEFQGSLAALRQRSLQNVGKALRLLHLRGRTTLYKLFGNDGEKLFQAVEMCRRACPNWEQPGWDLRALAPRSIEVRTAVDHGIPIDLLPLLDPAKPRTVDTMDDLARVAGSLLGFSAVVRRTLVGMPPNNDRLRIENMRSVPLKIFWDGSLPGAQTVNKFFEENKEHFDSKGGPWPNGNEPSDPDEFCESVGEYLWDPESSFDDGRSHMPDQLCFFYCHCDTSASSPDQYLLYLRRSGLLGRRHEVTLQRLTDELLSRSFNCKARPRPLVFLNACGSGGLDPASATSFPKLFLSKNLGFLGFIGTESTVPDAFSSQFAEVFYRHFVGGLPLGRALHAARWYMLRKYRSPLGILYTLYANPDIEVRSRIEILRQKLLS